MSSNTVSHINLNLTNTLNAGSEMDDLLPLFRRKVFDADLARLSQEALESSNSLVMLMVDIDRFKAINDTYGHPIGDQLLIGISKVISERARGKGKGYRFGGEEFAVLLPNYTSNEGIALAETIRKQIEQSLFTEKSLNATVSIGLAAVPEHARSSDNVVKAADAAMYQSKQLGRNLIRVFGEQKPIDRERVPERTIALPNGLSDDDRERIRVAYFSSRQPECPKDGTILRILKEFHAVGRSTPSILIMCPVCGLQEMIDGLEQNPR
jgi:diguanylate cyclase (GGDEF)-like protein